eukprot:scaffold520_cov224-Pinguiococcus_pyrenoidosus.AAC.7
MQNVTSSSRLATSKLSSIELTGDFFVEPQLFRLLEGLLGFKILLVVLQARFRVILRWRRCLSLARLVAELPLRGDQELPFHPHWTPLPLEEGRRLRGPASSPALPAHGGSLWTGRHRRRFVTQKGGFPPLEALLRTALWRRAPSPLTSPVQVCAKRSLPGAELVADRREGVLPALAPEKQVRNSFSAPLVAVVSVRRRSRFAAARCRKYSRWRICAASAASIVQLGCWSLRYGCEWPSILRGGLTRPKRSEMRTQNIRHFESAPWVFPALPHA